VISILATQSESVTFDEMCETVAGFSLAAKCDVTTKDVYDQLAQRYAHLETIISRE
jgi:hypothetical protein